MNENYDVRNITENRSKTAVYLLMNQEWLVTSATGVSNSSWPSATNGNANIEHDQNSQLMTTEARD